MYPKVPRSCQTGPAENTGLWVWPAPSRADRFSVVKLCVKLCNWVIGGESGEALHGEVRVRPEGSNTDVILRMPGQNAFSPAVALRAWSVLRALLLRSRGSALLPPGGRGACLGFFSSLCFTITRVFVWVRMLPCLALLFSTWSQLVLSLKGGGALAEVESIETLTWLSEMTSRSFPSASVHLVSHPLLPELK